MDCEEIRIDMRIPDPENRAENRRTVQVTCKDSQIICAVCYNGNHSRMRPLQSFRFLLILCA